MGMEMGGTLYRNSSLEREALPSPPICLVLMRTMRWISKLHQHRRHGANHQSGAPNRPYRVRVPGGEHNVGR